MHVQVKRAILVLVAVAAAVALAGCGTMPFFSIHSRAEGPRGAPNNTPRFQNGQVVEITGRVAVQRNQVTLQDQDSGVVFRFVGLAPGPRKTLTGLEGRNTRVRLKVLSVELPGL